MGTVNSDHVKASSEGAFGTSNESCYDLLNIVFRELVRLSILLIERKGTWSDHCFRPATKVSGDSSTRMNPGRISTCFATSVCELDSNLLVLRVSKFHNRLPGIGLLVEPNANIIRADATLRSYCGSFDKTEARSPANNTTNYNFKEKSI